MKRHTIYMISLSLILIVVMIATIITGSKRDMVNTETTKTRTTLILTTKPKPTTTKQQTKITSEKNIDANDREMLARLVYLEAGGISLEAQKAVASVVFNRLNNGYWGDTLKSVVYAKHQFTPASQIPYTTPSEKSYEAVDYVLKYGATLPSYILYFRADYGFSRTWEGYKEYKQIDNVFFGYFEKDK